MKTKYNFKHWQESDRVGDTNVYFVSDNDKLYALMVAPHKGNKFQWMVRVADADTFDRWSMAEIEKYFKTEDDAIDFLSSLDVNKKLPTQDEIEFYAFNKDIMWTGVHCNQIVEGKPHYRDNEDEQDYFICPICGKKVYIED